jgi:hypothetical protein
VRRSLICGARLSCTLSYFSLYDLSICLPRTRGSNPSPGKAQEVVAPGPGRHRTCCRSSTRALPRPGWPCSLPPPTRACTSYSTAGRPIPGRAEVQDLPVYCTAGPADSGALPYDTWLGQPKDQGPPTRWCWTRGGRYTMGHWRTMPAVFPESGCEWLV